jgi:hypothetical protein
MEPALFLAPAALAAHTLTRHDPDRLAAHQHADHAHQELHSLARLGAIYDHAARTATHRWLTTRLAEHGLGHAVRDGEWPSLLDRTRQAAQQGHNLDRLLHQAISMRPLTDANSAAGVLHWRLAQLTRDHPAVQHPEPRHTLPPADGDPHAELARTVSRLIHRRWRQLRTNLARHPGPLPYAPTLGPRPADPADAACWLDAATAVTAYRERYNLPDHTPLLGDRPSRLRPDAQTAYDHALLQVDRHLTRRYLHLNPQQLQTLRNELLEQLAPPPRFDPEQLRDAHLAATATRHTATTAASSLARTIADHQRHRATIDALERVATAHQTQRHRQTTATDQLRHLNLAARTTSRSR